MTTYTKTGSFGWAGGGKAGAIVDLWATSRFGGFPPQNAAPPDENPPDAGPATTGQTEGNPGGYLITGITEVQDYYVRVQYGGVSYWGGCPAGSLAGQGSGGGGFGAIPVAGSLSGDVVLAVNTPTVLFTTPTLSEGYWTINFGAGLFMSGTGSNPLLSASLGTATGTITGQNGAWSTVSISEVIVGQEMSCLVNIDTPGTVTLSIVSQNADTVKAHNDGFSLTGYTATPSGPGAAGNVVSVFTRTGEVVATSGDYTVSQVTGAAPLASPALTGVPTVPTASPGTNTTQAANTAFVTAAVVASTTGVAEFNGRTGNVVPTTGDYTAAQVTGAATLASPGFSGVPTAPTATLGTNTTQLATTAFVRANVGNLSTPQAGHLASDVTLVSAVNTTVMLTGTLAVGVWALDGGILVLPATTTPGINVRWANAFGTGNATAIDGQLNAEMDTVPAVGQTFSLSCQCLLTVNVAGTFGLVVFAQDTSTVKATAPNGFTSASGWRAVRVG